MKHGSFPLKEIVFYVVVPIIAAVIGGSVGASNNIYYNGTRITPEEFEAIINERDELKKETITLASELRNKEEMLSSLEDENMDLTNQVSAISAQVKDIKFFDRSLSINAKPLNIVGKVVEIDGISYFGEEFITYLADNENLSLSGDNINIGAVSTNNPSSLLSVAVPYDVTGDVQYEGNVVFNMQGKTYDKGIRCSTWAGGSMTFTLDRKYKTLMFDIGHIDNSYADTDYILSIYLDGEKERTITVSPKDFVSSYVIDLNYANVLKLEWDGSLAMNPSSYGIVNINVQ